MVTTKIKIGYFSADYHNHPVLHIMSSIFKLHDKTKFEFMVSLLVLKKKKIFGGRISNHALKSSI